MQYTKEQIKQKIRNFGYIPLEFDWVGYKTIISFTDEEGYLYSLSWYYFNNKCKQNFKFSIVLNQNKHSLYNIKKWLKNQGTTAILLSTEFKNVSEKLLFLGECGHEFECSWNKLKNRTHFTCSKCGNKRGFKKRALNQEFIEDEYKKVGYILLDKYINNSTPMRCQDKNGNIGTLCYSNLQMGKRFKVNKLSDLERIVANWLDDKNIEYKSEYVFPNCKYKRVLRFDFYLPKYNACIEVDGIFHFRTINNINPQYKLNQIRLRDKIKNKYTLDNNISLLRIDYKEIEDGSYKNKLESFVKNCV